MLSSIVTVIICVVGAYIGLNSIVMIFIELNPKTRACSRYYCYLLSELSTEEIREIGLINLAAYAWGVVVDGDFDYWYNHFIAKE